MCPTKSKSTQQPQHTTASQGQYQHSEEQGNNRDADSFQFQRKRNNWHTQPQHGGNYKTRKQYGTHSDRYNLGVSNRFTTLRN